MSEAIEIANGRALESAFVAPVPHDESAAKLHSSIDRSQRALLALQRPEGYWQAPLEANAEMNAEYIIFNRFMGVSDPEMDAKLRRYLLDLQQADGSWNLFPGGEGAGVGDSAPREDPSPRLHHLFVAGTEPR